MIREEAVCIMPLHTGKGCTESKAISGSMEDPQKTVNGRLITGYGCDSRTVDAKFLLADTSTSPPPGRYAAQTM